MENGNTATADTTAADYFGYTPTEIKRVDSNADTTTDDPHAFQTELNRLVKETTVGENGKFNYPKDTDPWAKVAIGNEKKFRDSQSNVAKTNQENLALKSENEALLARLGTQVSITPEQTEELNDLRHTDVDAYYAKRQEFEGQAQQGHTDFTTETRQQSAYEVESVRRDAVLADFNANREIKITDELVQTEIPPRVYKQLESGEVTFEQFLVNVATFVDTPKTVHAEAPIKNVADLGTVAGGSKPSKDGNHDKDLAEQYAKLVF